MLRVFGIASLVLAAVSAVSGHVIPHHKRAPPGWQMDILQKYPEYHGRYLDWGCQNQHNTTFFEKCCHPLLKKESISVLTDAGCKAPEDDCDDNGSQSPSSTSSSSSQPTSTTPSPETPAPSSPSAAGSLEKPKVVSSAPATTEPTSTPATTPTSTSPAPSATGNGGGDFNFGGVATFFDQNGVAGACGQVHQDSDLIAAIDQDRYGDAGNASPLCGKQVEIIDIANGNSVTVTIADDCPTCDNSNSIDLSKAAFQHLDNLSVGQVAIKWRFI